MSQNDFTIANQGFPAFRADLNSALQALASNSSGTSAPSTTFANMWWYDSANNIMYIRNEDNDAWIKFAELDQTNDKFVLSGTLQLDDGTVSAPALTFNSDTNMGIYRGGTDILKFVTAGTDAITINASQNIGIGTSSPNSRLTSASTDGSTGLSIHRTFSGNISGETTVGGLDFTLTDTATSNQIVSRISPVGSAGTGDAFAGAMRFYTAGNDGSIVERVRISQTGNVGIGCIPDSNLDVEGAGDCTISITANSTSNDSKIDFVQGSSIEGGITYDHNGAFASEKMFFRAGNNGTHMVLTGAGNVGIGNTNPEDFGSLVDNLVIGTTSGENGMTIASGTSNSGRIQFADNTSSPFRGAIEYSHSSDALLFYTAGSQRMSIQSNGRVNINTGNDTSTGFRFFAPSGQTGKVAEFARNDGVGCHLPVGSTAFTASSDETLKENITEFDKQTSYDDIKNMRAVTFNYKDWTLNGTTYQDNKRRIGFIAQDWVTNYPEIIDRDQNDKLCLKYTETIPVLLSALQKAQEKIEAMEARITTLEGE